MEANHHHHHHHHTKKHIHTSSRILINYAIVVELLLFVCATYQLFLTLVIPVGENTNPIAAYSRNFSTAFGLAYIGWFLLRWLKFILRSHRTRTRIIFKILLIVTCLISVTKGLISFSVIHSFIKTPFSAVYYFCDFIAWITLGCFFASFFWLWQASNHMRHAIRKSRTFNIILIVACAIKLLSSAYFTILQFIPGQLVWHYFLCDTISWAAITVLFCLYSNYRVREHKRLEKRPDLQPDTDTTQLSS